MEFFIDIDGVVRDLESAVYKKQGMIKNKGMWEKDFNGLSFYDVVYNNREILVTAEPFIDMIT